MSEYYEIISKLFQLCDYDTIEFILESKINNNRVLKVNTNTQIIIEILYFSAIHDFDKFIQYYDEYRYFVSEQDLCTIFYKVIQSCYYYNDNSLYYKLNYIIDLGIEFPLEL